MKLDKLLYTALSSCLLLGMSACEKNNVAVDQDAVVPPEAARFIISPALRNSPYYNYFIEETPAPGSSFSIPVGVTTVSQSDRKVKLSYSSRTAVAGTNFTAPEEITIPAGQSTGSVLVQGLFDAYPSGRKDTLKIRITSGDGVVNSFRMYDSVMLIMQKFCPVDATAFEGVYGNSRELSASGALIYGPYDIDITEVVPVNATSVNAVIGNIYGYGGAVAAKIDWTDKANFKVTIAEQNSGALYEDTDGSIYELWFRTASARTSTFSSCDQTLTLFVDVIAKEVDTHAFLGYFEQNYRIVLAR